MSDVADPRVLLDKHGLRAKKSWGQNFLLSEKVYASIVHASVRAPSAWVVEIGAGLGTLTARLSAAATAGRVVAVERDRDMVTVLRAELAACANVEIVEANALEFDYAAVAARAGGRVTVAGNLPYQIATPLIFKMLEARAHVERMIIMLQKEVAARLVAAPSSSAYGAMGVMVRTYADVRVVVRVPPTAFFPKPKVDSTVVEITPLAGAKTRAPIDDEARYSALVHAGFGQRRKTLRNAMRSRWESEEIVRALEVAGIDGERRGETLSVEEFAKLANVIAPARKT